MNENYYPSFKYIDIGTTGAMKWERVLIADLEKYRNKFNNVDFCMSVARYVELDPQKQQPNLMGIAIDLDGENGELEGVLNEAQLLRDYFYREWDLSKEEVRFYFTGHRSIHIKIQPESLGIMPSEKLHLYIREIVRVIADTLELECVDYSLYKRRNLYRCVGTLHSKTNKYKVEIDPSELNLPAEELKKLGDRDRGVIYAEDDLKLAKNEIASNYFNKLLEIAKKSVDEYTFRESTEQLSILKGLDKYPACVDDLLKNNIRVKGTRNRATLVLTTFLKDMGKSKEDIIEILTPWAKAMSYHLTSADERKRLNHVEDMANYAFSDSGREYHFACPFIRSLGSKENPIACKKRCQLKIAEKMLAEISHISLANIIPTSYLPEIGGFLVDLVYDPVTKIPSFALYNPEKGDVSYVEKITLEYPDIYVPLIDENVIKGNVLLPEKAEEYGTDEHIYNEVNNFISKYYNETDKSHRTLNSLYVFFTWVYDKFRSWCYLQFLGSAGGGKSRALEAIGYICYRPIKLAGADSPPCMFRMLDMYRGTTLIDEATFTNKSEAHLSIIQILNVGYKRDGSVGRCMGDDNKPVRYMVGSPKILATRKDFLDDGLRSRCIVRRTGRDHRIKEGEHKQPFILPEGFEEEARALRNKLLLWRFRHWEKAKLDPGLEIKGVESRFNEISVPILSVMNSNSVKGDIEELAKEQQEDLKLQRQNSTEGEVLRAIKEIELNTEDIPSATIKEKINSKLNPQKDKLIATHGVTKILKRLEFKLFPIANKYFLTANDENKKILSELLVDYNLSETDEENETDPGA